MRARSISPSSDGVLGIETFEVRGSARRDRERVEFGENVELKIKPVVFNRVNEKLAVGWHRECRFRVVLRKAITGSDALGGGVAGAVFRSKPFYHSAKCIIPTRRDDKTIRAMVSFTSRKISSLNDKSVG